MKALGWPIPGSYPGSARLNKPDIPMKHSSTRATYSVEVEVDIRNHTDNDGYRCYHKLYVTKKRDPDGELERMDEKPSPGPYGNVVKAVKTLAEDIMGEYDGAYNLDELVIQARAGFEDPPHSEVLVEAYFTTNFVLETLG